MVDRQDPFDEASHTCGMNQVAERTFHRTQSAVRARRFDTGEHFFQGCNFDRVTQWRRGPVGFDETDRRGIDISLLQR